jgi:hypothetical protein
MTISLKKNYQESKAYAFLSFSVSSMEPVTSEVFEIRSPNFAVEKPLSIQWSVMLVSGIV